MHKLLSTYRIINNNANFQNSQVYLMFGGITTGLDAIATVNGTPNTALVLGTSYVLSQVSDIKLRLCLAVIANHQSKRDLDA